MHHTCSLSHQIWIKNIKHLKLLFSTVNQKSSSLSHNERPQLVNKISNNKKNIKNDEFNLLIMKFNPNFGSIKTINTETRLFKSMKNSFSTNTNTNQKQQQQSELKQQQHPNHQSIANEPAQQPLKQYIDYKSIFQKNKILLQTIQQSLKNSTLNASKNKIPKIKQSPQVNDEFPITPQYLQKNILKKKYFYSDLVKISYQLIRRYTKTVQKDSTSNEIEQVQKIKQTNIKITQTQIHFLLYTYHLYTKEMRNYKDDLYSILDDWISAELKTICEGNTEVDINMKHIIQGNMELHILLRKFLQSQIYFGYSQKANKLCERYCELISKNYELEKEILQKEVVKVSVSQNVVKKGKLLQNYLLTFPNIWVSAALNNITINNKSGSVKDNYQDKTHNMKNRKEAQFLSQTRSQTFCQPNNINNFTKLSPILIENYDFLLNEFISLYNMSLTQWLQRPMSKELLPQNRPPNISYRKILVDQYNKQLKLIPCFNQLLMIHHRLCVILQPLNSSIQLTKKLDFQNDIAFITQKYLKNKLNILSYLPFEFQSQSSSKNQQKQIKFMRVMILLKKIVSYHTLRSLDSNVLGDYLEKFFNKNYDQIIMTKDLQKRRDIKFLMGDLVSKLVSAMWIDQDDRLGKYFGNTGGQGVINNNNRVMNNNNGSKNQENDGSRENMNNNTRNNNNNKTQSNTIKKASNKEWVNLHDV